MNTCHAFHCTFDVPALQSGFERGSHFPLSILFLTNYTYTQNASIWLKSPLECTDISTSCFLWGTTSPLRVISPRFWKWEIVHKHAILCWIPLDEWSAHRSALLRDSTIFKRDRHLFLRLDSNPKFQQANDHKSTS